MWRRVGRLLALPAAALVLAVTPASSQAKVQPYGYHDAGGFLNVLPAGEAGTDTAAPPSSRW